MISYEAIFFDEDTINLIHSLEPEHLPLVNDEIHCTFKYHPTEEEYFDDLVGRNFELTLVGYGNDGMNSGFQIALPEELIPYYINYDEDRPNVLKVPHITTSISEGAKAYKTKDLDFQPLEKTIKITGRFGYWIKSEDKEYISFEKSNKNDKNKKMQIDKLKEKNN